MSLRRGGFTLLEVLAALAVLGLVLLSLTQGVQFGLRAWRAQSTTDTRQTELEAMDRTLRLLVERTIGGDWLKDRGALRGGPMALDLVTVLPPWPGGPPDPTVNAWLEVNARHQLVLRWVPLPHAQWLGQRQVPLTTVLMEGVARLELSYWQMEKGGGGTWMRGWTDIEPPALVRMRVIFPPGDPRHWPDIVAEPRLSRALS